MTEQAAEEPKKKRSQSSLDAETTVLKRICKTLMELEPDQRERVLAYAQSFVASGRREEPGEAEEDPLPLL